MKPKITSFGELFRAWCARRALGKPYVVQPRDLLDDTGRGDVTPDEWREMVAVAEHSPHGYIEVFFYGMHYALSVFTDEHGKKFANLLDMNVVRWRRLPPMEPVSPPLRPNCFSTRMNWFGKFSFSRS